MELIDKSKVVAELERLIFVCDSVISDYDHREYRKMYEERRKAYVNVRNFLDTLEVKEEVLDENDKTKLMRKCVKVAYKRGYDMGVLQTTNKINSNIKEVNIAEMADDYYNALMQEADWMDEGTMGHCRLAYYTGCKDVLNKIQKGE